MALNILIGIGGTGAKIVESALMTCVAGLPLKAGDLRVGLVDQDAGNGNVQRTAALLRLVEAVQREWTASDGEHRWTPRRASEPGVRPEDRCSLAATSVRGMETLLWHPHPERGKTLAKVFGVDALLDGEDVRLRLLMDALYAPDATEQHMELSEGYRGRPHIGAAAILSRPVESSPFLTELRDALSRAKGGEDVRVFLAGSVFGGTGAAGFPTIARMLRELARASGAGGTVRIGGALMLPYFSFDPPADGSANVARSEDLLRQSQAALKYYDELFRAHGADAVFDELYLTGWDPAIRLGYHSPGSKSQANPALLPELFAALGAMRFFAQDEVRAPEHGTPVFVSARREASAVGWNDLPQVVDDPSRRQEHQRELARLLRFAAFWRNTLKPELRNRTLLEARPPWYKRNDLGKVRFEAGEVKRKLDLLDELMAQVLVWAGAIQMFEAVPQGGFALWNVAPLVRFDPEDPDRAFVTVKDRLPDQAAADVYRGLILERDPERPRPPDQATLFQEINNAARVDAHSGLGRLVAAVHHAARVPDAQPVVAA